MDSAVLTGVFLIFLGIFTMAVGVMGWESMMRARFIRMVEMVIGRQATRVFLVICGLAMMVLGGTGIAAAL